MEPKHKHYKVPAVLRP